MMVRRASTAAIQCLLFKSREMTGIGPKHQSWWLGGEGLKTTENKLWLSSRGYFGPNRNQIYTQFDQTCVCYCVCLESFPLLGCSQCWTLTWQILYPNIDLQDLPPQCTAWMSTCNCLYYLYSCFGPGAGAQHCSKMPLKPQAGKFFAHTTIYFLLLNIYC